MKLFENILKIGVSILEQTGSETPNQACPDRWKCRCGLVWYYPSTVSTPGRVLHAKQAGKPCSKHSDGRHILTKDC